jgi:hypothetical protein
MRPAQDVSVRRNQLRDVEGERTKAELIRVQQVRPEVPRHIKQNSRALLEDKFILLHPLERRIGSSELKIVAMSEVQ